MTALAALIGVLLAIPAYSAPVVDEADRVPDDVERSVSATLMDFERRSTNEIAVAVVKTTGKESIEDYANDLLRLHWKPGSGGRDNGVVYVIALEDRRVRIEVGNDLQGELTDLETGEIVRERLVPLLAAGDLGGAVVQGTQAIRLALGDDQAGVLPPPLETEPGAGEEPDMWQFLPVALVALGVMGAFGRGRRRWGGGVPIVWGGGWGGGGGGGGWGAGGGGGGWSGGGGGGGASGGGASGGW